MSSAVLYVYNVEGSRVTLDVHDGSNTSLVTTHGDHDEATNSERNVSSDFTSLNRNTDSIVLLDGGIREADSTTVMSGDHRDTSVTNAGLGHTAKLVLLLLLVDTVKNETSLGVEEKTESILALLDCDDI